MIVKKLVEKAMEKAQGAQASLSQSESTDVSFENDKLKSARSSQGTHMSLKVIVDGKVGSSHTTDINDVDGVVKRALEVAEFGSPAHFQFPSHGSHVKVILQHQQCDYVLMLDDVRVGDNQSLFYHARQPEVLSRFF